MKGLLSAALEARQVSASLEDCWESRQLGSQEGRGIAGVRLCLFFSPSCVTKWLSGLFHLTSCIGLHSEVGDGLSSSVDS